MTTISRLCIWPRAPTSLAGATWKSAKAWMGRRIFYGAFPRERGLWAMAACFFSLLIRCNTEEAGFP